MDGIKKIGIKKITQKTYMVKLKKHQKANTHPYKKMSRALEVLQKIFIITVMKFIIVGTKV